MRIPASSQRRLSNPMSCVYQLHWSHWQTLVLWCIRCNFSSHTQTLSRKPKRVTPAHHKSTKITSTTKTSPNHNPTYTLTHQPKHVVLLDGRCCRRSQLQSQGSFSWFLHFTASQKTQHEQKSTLQQQCFLLHNCVSCLNVHQQMVMLCQIWHPRFYLCRYLATSQGGSGLCCPFQNTMFDWMVWGMYCQASQAPWPVALCFLFVWHCPCLRLNLLSDDWWMTDYTAWYSNP